jgi:hypothetical protein
MRAQDDDVRMALLKGAGHGGYLGEDDIERFEDRYQRGSQ